MPEETRINYLDPCARRHIAIHGCHLSGVRRSKQFRCWAVDGKADRVLHGSHRRKSEPPDRSQSGRHHAVRRIGTGIWLGPAVASRKRPADVCRSLVKFAMLCDVELRWNATSFLSQTDPSGTHRSFGDNWLGPQIRFYRQTKRVPTMAFSCAIKIPSPSTGDGLGSGRVDHAFTLLASKDIANFHFDFNITQFLDGRPHASGFDKISKSMWRFHT
jgi:hypothetical protein